MTQLTSQQLLDWIPRLASHHVLVLGDLFLDEYILGQATRLSREAPIPVLEFVQRFYVPGGAANPAHNICALGGHATVVGVVGADQGATQLQFELQRVGIGRDGLVVDPSRPTTTKTRIMAQGSLRFPQQMARVDHIDRRPLSSEIEAQLIGRVEELLPLADALLVSDYQTGVASPNVVQESARRARSQGKLCTVDAQGAFHKYAGFDLVKGNRQEVEAALSRPLHSDEDHQLAGERLLNDLGINAAIITRGPEGLSLISRQGPCWHLAAANRSEVFDVTGAGDTVIAVATLALCAGASVLTAAHLANYAAGLVVRKLGNAVTTRDELAWAIQTW